MKKDKSANEPAGASQGEEKQPGDVSEAQQAPVPLDRMVKHDGKMVRVRCNIISLGENGRAYKKGEVFQTSERRAKKLGNQVTIID